MLVQTPNTTPMSMARLVRVDSHWDTFFQFGLAHLRYTAMISGELLYPPEMFVSSQSCGSLRGSVRAGSPLQLSLYRRRASSIEVMFDLMGGEL